MEILKGLLFINGDDVFTKYGAFLSEDKPKDNTNYSALLTPPKMKSYTSVSFREEDGEKLPEKLTPAFEARDVTLQFAITAAGKKQFIERYTNFVKMLRSGWLEIKVPELDKTYKMIYSSCTEYSQLTAISADTVAGKFKVKFREPQPTI